MNPTTEELRIQTGKALRKLSTDVGKLCGMVEELARVIDDQQAKLEEIEGRLTAIE